MTELMWTIKACAIIFGVDLAIIGLFQYIMYKLALRDMERRYAE
jgi:hypothetical protein